MKKLITFLLNGQTMAMDSQYIKKIIKLEPLTKIPSSEKFLEGVINYQQTIMPVINIKAILGIQDTSIYDSSSIIAICKDGETTGILVDYVDDIVDVNEEEICKDISNCFIQGVVKIDNKIVMILNPVIRR
ncbi:purine-binding chemotaxis protein CheW [Clostridium punense]|uniref:Purine-binding chemotaxis protein CheW n=1 Tax=Clostridium punense TaxID=1054297 RepID=A0ABS4K9E6_9CLOT|nr:MULTISPECIES: chemotaxis protein CheW [Clostridium]EQB89093.1 hypothetical protein M918_21975 [Clostridium sp. BL8]MBP2024395.1 purine-binding chemotaxis protein CheW [Clostridium punense]